MKKSLLKILFFSIISSHIFISKSLKALIPYYYFPETKNLYKESLTIGKQAYQLLYFGQIKDSLNLARLAVKINKNMKKSLLKILFFSIISSHFFVAEGLKALIPYYYFPETKSLEKGGLLLGKQAYQMLYFGRFKDSLNLAKYISPILGFSSCALFSEINALL